jgi:dolichyl-phosphate-mannose--protein O-mannosyl transferase
MERRRKHDEHAGIFKQFSSNSAYSKEKGLRMWEKKKEAKMIVLLGNLFFWI